MATVTEQVGNQILKIGGNFVKGTAEFIEELMKAIDKNKEEDPNKYAVAAHMKKGGQIVTMQVEEGQMYDLLKQYLGEQNVPFLFLDNNNADNCKTLVIRDFDKIKAEFAMKMVFAEMGQNVEFEKDEFINITAKDKLACVSGLAEHEYELFRIKARDNGLKFAATVGKDDKINILYSVDEQSRMDKAMRQMSWNLTGRNGDEYETAFKTRAEAQEHIKLMHKKKAKPVYLVDARHPDLVLKVEKDAVTLCRAFDDKLSKETNFENGERFPVTDKAYITRLGEILDKFSEPVVITEREFWNRKETIEKKLPKLDKEWDEKERGFFEQFEKALDGNAAKMADKLQEPDFSFTAYVESDVVYEGDIEITPNDKKEMDEHIKETVTRVKTYEVYQPKSNVLLKHLEEVKKKRTIEQAKHREEDEKGKETVRENKKSYRDR